MVRKAETQEAAPPWRRMSAPWVLVSRGVAPAGAPRETGTQGRLLQPGIEVRPSLIPFPSWQACDRMGAHAIGPVLVPAFVKGRIYPG